MPRSLQLWTYFIPAFGFATFLTCYWGFIHFANPGVSGLEPTVRDSSIYAEARIRMQWLATMVAFTFLAAVAIGSIVIDLYAHQRDEGGTRIWRYDDPTRILASVGLLAAVVVSFLIVFGDGMQLYFFAGTNLFDAVFALCGEEACFGSGTYKDSFDFFMRYGVTVAAIGLSSCALGSILSLARRRGEPASETDVGHAKYYLYISSALLSFGLLGLMAWLRLPLSVLADSETSTPATLYTEHAKAMVLYWGVSFSVVILAFNLPTMVALHLARAPSDADAATRPASVTNLREVVTASVAFLTPAVLPLSVELGGNLLSFLGGGG